jgi:hypothetical protein
MRHQLDYHQLTSDPNYHLRMAALGEFDYIIVGAAARVACSPTASRRTAPATSAGRSRRQGRLVLDRHPGRLPLHHRQPAHRLVLPHGIRAGPERPQPRIRARQGPGRLLVDQRDGLHARPEGRLRPLGGARQSRLVWDEVLPYFKRAERHFGGAQRAPRLRRRALRGRAARALGDPRRLARGRPSSAASRRSTSSTAATTSATPTST